MRQTPSSAVWGLIESALYASNIKKKDLAKIAGVHANTVSRDAENPDHIPLGRVCLYCSGGIFNTVAGLNPPIRPVTGADAGPVTAVPLKKNLAVEKYA